jgi:DinB superfamily
MIPQNVETRMGSRVDFLVRRLTEEGEALLAQLDALAPETWAVPVYPAAEGSWVIHSILAHLVSAEGYIRLMISDIVAGGPGAPSGVDVDATNATEVASLSGCSPADLIDKLRDSRAASIAMVAAFSEDDLDRRGNHALLGQMALEDFVKLIYRHDRMHMRDVQHALKLSTWV